MDKRVTTPHLLDLDDLDTPRRNVLLPVEVVVGNLVECEVDAVVNAANGSLQMGGGVAGAIRSQDVDGRVGKECQEIHGEVGQLEEGAAAITCGWKGGPPYVIHAVGPVYRATHHKECVKRLYSAYWSALTLAARYGVKSMAFPFLSAGIFGFTADKGSAGVARRAVEDFVSGRPGEIERIVFVSLPRDAALRESFG